MKKTNETVKSWILVVVGAILAAFSLEEFLAPNNLLDGGVTGISMVIVHAFKMYLPAVIAVLNIPFMIIGYREIGKSVILRFIVAVLVFSVAAGVFERFDKVTDESLLAVIYGGIMLGIGVGMVLRGGGCIDGTEIVAIILARRFGISTGNIILYVNVLVYSIAAIVFGLDRGMYSLLMYFVTSKVIDIVETGLDSAKSVMIITESGEEMANLIFEKLGRTVTYIKGEGHVSQDKKTILYCVVTRAEIYELKKLIKQVNGSTFTTISDVTEIVGNHVKSSTLTQ
ncbi:MAG: YitT family protein [Eubacterium sp.]|nr:YitT family protein [Eubacterium sp.]